MLQATCYITMDKIVIRGARVHNLKNINLEIPKNKLVVITGLSGSGKSSLAFDTIYAEASRRFIESLSSYAKQFLELQVRPDADEISGLTPAIAIDQRGLSENPRSTLATTTEIADYLRLLFARIGRPFCPCCKKELRRRSPEEIVEAVFSLLKKQPLKIFAPLNRRERQINEDTLKGLLKAGFEIVNFNRQLVPIATLLNTDLPASFELEILVANLSPFNLESDKEYVRDRILTALDFGDGALSAEVSKATEIFSKNKNKSQTQVKKERYIFSQELTCPECGKSVPSLEPRNFSFNSPYGACPACGGLGVRQVVEPDLVIPNPRLTLSQGAIQPWVRLSGNQSWHLRLLEAVAKAHKFSTEIPVARLNKKDLQIVLYGAGQEEYQIDSQKVKFCGVIPELEKKYQETTSDYLRKEIENYMRSETCPDCQGRRFKKESLNVFVAEKNIAEILALSVEQAIAFFAQLIRGFTSELHQDAISADEEKIAKPIFKEIISRLKHLQEAGLGYLKLDRASPTLSGGESARVRLAVQLGAALSGVLYILDEPTVGLHDRDTEKLIVLLKQLRDAGNSIIVVEHDEAMIKSADWIIDIGPGAGVEGGEIVAYGTLRSLLKNKSSLTASYLSSPKTFEFLKKQKRFPNKFIKIKGAKGNNLKNLNVQIPLSQFVCVTGVSGSGKSTLILDTLAKAVSRKFYRTKDLPAPHQAILGAGALDKIITIDQAPIGRTPRSNPATYTGIFTLIRDLFASLPEAKMKNFDAGKFSFNVRGGRCEACAGEGYLKVPMQFLPETFIECLECRGKRYRPEALEIFYKNKNISDILEMTVSEALSFFDQADLLTEKLKVLKEVGLGYIKLGQPATTLSGGEAQRVKLASELGRRATGKTLYILDEPTVGLHFEDIKHLLKILRQLVDKGNSMIVIEHNLFVITSADWIIDLGPEGGDKGGEIMAEGPPDKIIKVKNSYTGEYLKRVL